MKNETTRVGFGGGCHWCTEAVFLALRGIVNVKQGFICSKHPNDSYSEAVIVNFDPGKIDLMTLIEVHLRTHSSTSNHKLRGKYRSAIYVFDETQQSSATQILHKLQLEFEMPIVTSVLPYVEFISSDERFENYYDKDPSRPFCTTYIDPKLKLLREQFAKNVRT